MELTPDAATVKNPRAYLALVIGIVAIAWSAIFVRWAPIPGPASAFYRLLIASILLWPYLLMFRLRSLRMSGRSLKYAAIGGLFFAGDLACYNTAILHTSAANAVLLSTNAPIFVGLMSWLILRRPPRSIFWTGLAVATSGSLLILFNDLFRSSRPGFGKADLLAVATSFFFAGYLTITASVRDHVESIALLGISLLASTACLAAFNLALGISFRVPANTRIWGGLLGMGIVSQLIGYFALTYALGHLPATITSVTLLAQAPLTALLAYGLLGERFGIAQTIGALLVLAGIAIVNRNKPQPTLLEA